MAQINIVKKSQMYEDNEKQRIDAEFFSNEYLDVYRKIKKHRHCILSDTISVFTDFHANGSYESIARNFELLDEPDFAYMVRSTDLESQNFVDDVKYVSEHSYNFLKKSQIFGGEILINKIGTPGRTFLMPKLNKPVSLGMNLFMLRLKGDSPINNIFVWLFLNTEIGKKVISRKVNGAVPLTIDKAAIRSLPLPIVSNEFQQAISKLVTCGEQLSSKSKSLYAEAEATLLESLGLIGFTPSANKFSVRGMAESFSKSNRIDAEYYQPKFDELMGRLKAFNCNKLGKLVTTAKSIEPGSSYYSNEGVPFVRVADITKFGISCPDIKVPAHLTELRPIKDTILLTKDGSVGIAYKVEEDLDYITSGALLHLTVKQKGVLPDYLTLVLNSIVVQLQAERDAGGSIIQHWKPSEIENVVIPILDDETQNKITADIQNSFSLRSQSEQLLDLAKQAVEMAIEDDEDAAIKWLGVFTKGKSGGSKA